MPEKQRNAGKQKNADKQLRAIFSGHVQGVGFRFRTLEISRNFAVKGYVQNRDDGTVELLIEGEKPELEGMLAEIGEKMEGNIRGIRTDWSEASGNYTGFQIRRELGHAE